jgi:hypothetical protein
VELSAVTDPKAAANKHGVECAGIDGCKYGSKCRSECEVRRALKHLASLQPAQAAASPTDDWQHLKPFGYAPGNYMCECQACKIVTCDLDKRAITCRPCAEKAFAAASPEPVAIRYPTPGNRWRYAGRDDTVTHEALESCEPLYLAPPAADERIAQLESLLREALHICHLGDGDTDLHERIRAALGEG